MQTDSIKELLYNDDLSEIKNVIASSTDAETLHMIALNYNWEDGFEIPKMILKNSACSLSTALLIFYMGDGYRYLSERPVSSGLTEWFSFISKLYTDITQGVYRRNDIAFEIPLSKIQLFKLKKTLSEAELVFVTPIDGKNCDLEL